MAQMEIHVATREPCSDHDDDDDPPLRPDEIDENPSGGDGDNDVNKPRADGQKKKKHRRGKSKKRRWKPYYKMSWKEKREQEDRETLRATRVRAERFAHGQPVAPYNTTQFLMEDHNVQEPDFDHMANGHRHHRESTSVESSDEFYSSPEDEEEFLQKEFSEVYENIHAERLNSMSKTELIQEYIQLEDRVDKLERKLKEMETARGAGRGEDGGRGDGEGGDAEEGVNENEAWDTDAESAEKIRIFQEEIQKLAGENNRLRTENKRLLQKNGTIFPEPPSPASVDGD